MPTHITAARDALLTYIHSTGKTDFLSGNKFFSKESNIGKKGGIGLGRLSGIVAHYVPSYLQKSRMPSWETNCIDDWEEKVDAIVEETLPEKMTLIGGIPHGFRCTLKNQTHYRQSCRRSVSRVLSFCLWGVNFEPYRSALKT